MATTTERPANIMAISSILNPANSSNMIPPPRSSRIQRITRESAALAGRDLFLSVALVNMSRGGSGKPPMTIQEAINEIKQRTLPPPAGDCDDRLWAAVHSTYADTLERMASQLDQDSKPIQKSNTKTPVSKAAQNTRVAKAKPVSSPKTVIPKVTKKLPVAGEEHKIDPTTKLTKAAKRSQVAKPRPVSDPETSTSKVAEKLPVAEEEHKSGPKTSTAKAANKSQRSKPKGTRDPKTSTPEAVEKMQVNKFKHVNEPEDEDSTDDDSSRTQSAEPEAAPDVDSTRTRNDVYGRSSKSSLNRGHIEMFGKAVHRVVSNSIKDDVAIIPDYSSTFSDSEPEKIIAEYIFIKAIDERHIPKKEKRFWERGAMKTEDGQKKYAEVKKRLLFGAAMLWELNCQILEEEGSFPLAKTRPVAPAPNSDNGSQTAAPSSTASSEASTTPSAEDSSPFRRKPRKEGHRLYDLNVTRMQPPACINVGLVRPMMRAYRPKDDKTWQRDPSKKLKEEGVTVSGPFPYENNVAGLLAPSKQDVGPSLPAQEEADVELFPPMIKRTIAEDKADVDREELINDSWYNALGTKEERQVWLEKVLLMKIVVEKEAILNEERKRKRAEEAERAAAEGFQQQAATRPIKRARRSRALKTEKADSADSGRQSEE